MTPGAPNAFIEIDDELLKTTDPAESSVITWERVMSDGLAGYRVNAPVAGATEILYPSLLSGRGALEMSREDLETEIRLILEMKQHAAFGCETYIYSIGALTPNPFRPSVGFEDLLQSFSVRMRNQVRAGFIVHDDLYELGADAGKLVGLLETFLLEVSAVEVKAGRAGETAKPIRVALTAK